MMEGNLWPPEDVVCIIEITLPLTHMFHAPTTFDFFNYIYYLLKYKITPHPTLLYLKNKVENTKKSWLSILISLLLRVI